MKEDPLLKERLWPDRAVIAGFLPLISSTFLEPTTGI